MFIKIPTPDAILFAGNKSKLADLLGITRQSLTSWGPFLPQSSALKLYILTDGKLGTKVNENFERTHSPNKSKTTPNTMFYP